MRHTYRVHRANKRRLNHDYASWILLVFSWAIALSTVLMIGHAVFFEEASTIEQSAPTVVEAFAANPETHLEISLNRYKALKSLRNHQPTILIYHTHTTEAYFQNPSGPYRESSRWRTNDNTKNVVRVGEALKEILEREYGFHVIHDITDHEPPKLSSSYDRSLKTMQKYHIQYPSIVLFIDLHRDAYQETENPVDYLVINGIETAKLMFVVGKGEKYTEKPFFETNRTLAQHMTEYLQSVDAKLARPVRIKSGRYNQQVSPNCILVEVGHNANTLEQALAAMPYFAESIAYAFTNDSEEAIWNPI